MANMIKDLLAPEQAKLLDDQLRKQSLQQGVTNYGNDSMGKFLTAASGAQRASEGFGMAAQRAIAGRQMGANEARAVQGKEKREAELASLREQATNAIYATPALNEEAASNLLMAIQKDPTGKRAEQVINKYGLPDAPQNTAADFIKTVQLGVNNGSITAESGIAAIEAEQNQNGSGRDLLKYPSKEAETAAEKDLSAKDTERYNNLLDETATLRRKNLEIKTITQLLDSVKPTAGAAAQINAIFKDVFGTQNTESVLKARIETLRVAQAIGNLPPGVATDKDVELVLKGTLPSTANPEALKEWFAALNRLNSVAIEESSAQLEYYDRKGSLKGYFTERKEFNRKRAEELAEERQSELDRIVKTRQEKIAKAKAKEEAAKESERRKLDNLRENQNIETDFFGRF